MRITLVAALLLAAFSAPAGTISSLDPASFQAYSGEHFISVRGHQLGGQLIFDGPAGRIEVAPSTADANLIRAFVPVEVINTPGRYSLRVGDSNTVGFDVIEPQHALVVLGQDPVVVEAESARGAHVTYEVHTYGGQDPNPTVTCNPPSGSLFPLGPSNVLCVATNTRGERAEGGVYIYVYDATVPVLTLPGDIVVEADSRDGTVVNFEATAYDAIDGEVSVSCTPASGSLFPVGVTMVECTAFDSSLNPATGMFSVEVKQKEGDPPQLLIQVPSDIEIEAETPAGAVVTFAVTTHGSTDPDPVVTCSPATESVFPLGTTQVVCIATDNYGLRAEGSFLVKVIDTTPPDVRTADLSVQGSSSGGAVVEYDVVGVDLVDGEIAATCEPPSGSQFPAGATTVQCTATDSSGNIGRGTFTVTVSGTSTPVLFLQVPDDVEVEADGPDGRLVTFAVTTSGSTDPNPIVTCTPSSGSLFAFGTTTVNCTATDSYGQSVEHSFEVNVVDSIAPIISSVAATPNVLVPANHKMIDVEVTIDASDGIDPMPQCSVVDVTANEAVDAPGSGNTNTDWLITGDLTLQLRAERSGEGSDRIYTVHVSCVDASGNAAHESVDVVVPKSSSSEQDAVIEKGSSRRRSVGRGR